LPTNARTVPTSSQWAYEIKHDGFRFICRREGDRLRAQHEASGPSLPADDVQGSATGAE
jgi:hypothetical protein